MIALRTLKPRLLAATGVFVLVLAGAAQSQAGELQPASPPIASKIGFRGVECRYVPRGAPGAAGNELRLTGSERSFAFVEISDNDGKLRVGGVRGCDGPRKPRLNNVDSIALNLRRSVIALVSIKTSGAVLGPGATRENDGSSEIEISADNAQGFLSLQLGGTDHSVTTEAIGDERVGINATAAVDGDTDVRASVRSGLQIGLGDGDDQLSAGVAVSPSPSPRLGARSVVVLSEGLYAGDAGDDSITGSEGFDAIGGGSGSDTLTGGDGFDFIDGGEDDDLLDGNGDGDFIDAKGGNDDVSGGAGPDFVRADDGKVDRIDCGGGKDTAEVDRRRDLREGCEEIRAGRDRPDDRPFSASRAEQIEYAQRVFRRDGR